MPRDIIIEQAGAVRRVVINRPEVRNACRAITLSELDAALADAFADPSVSVVELAGAGDTAFCAGADLKEMATRTTAAAIVEAMGGWWRVLDTLRRAPKPVIAGVKGFAVGGGTEIVLHCHIVIAATSARFGLPEVRRGHMPGAGGTVFLPRRIGRAAAAYYLLTGNDILAEDALRLGLAAKVVPDAALGEEMRSLGEHIGTLAPAAVRGIVKVLSQSEDMNIEDSIALERAACAEIRGGNHFNEGIRAFVEKRPPAYEGEADA